MQMKIPHVSIDLKALKEKRREEIAAWKAVVAQFQVPSIGKATWQIVNTLGSYLALWVIMYFTISISWWLTIPLAILAGGLLIRAFIIFHDCGHGSYFKSRKANDLFGFICGVFTFTPYHQWRWEHARHHATSGNLDHRGTGDIWTMTVKEYLEAPRAKRCAYRIHRNPIVLFVIGPLYMFIFHQRWSCKGSSKRERRSVMWTNLALLIWAVGMSLIFGVGPFIAIQLIAMGVAGSAGVWFFYVQHQFEDVYWARGESWDYTAAALEGSSFYKLPKVLQWFSGNIGFHHIHHLSPRIPNYNLEKCHKSDPMFSKVSVITLFTSMKSISLRLWDESAKKLVSFHELRRMLKQQAKAGEVRG
jgi:acyl-lipid omega-6 desaturase (Delta-12 desaturase)